MKSEQLFEAIGMADEQFIDNCHKRRYGKVNIIIKIGALAACAALLIGFIYPWRTGGLSGGGSAQSGVGPEQSASDADVADAPDGEGAVAEEYESDENSDGSAAPDGVTIPPEEVTLGRTDGIEVDMSAFFIYNGHCYAECGYVENGELVGDYVGTATGMIDEWTPEDGYVELAGSVNGDFYTVNGYDPSFMLCMRSSGDENWTQLFTSSTGITLTDGGDIYDERLHIKGRVVSARYRTWSDYFYGNEIYEDVDMETVNSLIDALCSAPCVLTSDVPLPPDASTIWKTAEGILYLTLDDSLPVELYTFSGGYVMYSGLRGACVADVDIDALPGS